MANENFKKNARFLKDVASRLSEKDLAKLKSLSDKELLEMLAKTYNVSADKGDDCWTTFDCIDCFGDPGGL